jgi:hypothetical protein
LDTTENTSDERLFMDCQGEGYDMRYLVFHGDERAYLALKISGIPDLRVVLYEEGETFFIYTRRCPILLADSRQ